MRLKAKSEGLSRRSYRVVPQGKALFLPGNLQWKLVNSLHATTHLEEKALQGLLERSFRGTGLQTTIRHMVSSCPTCQLNNPKELRPQLAQPVQWGGAYPGGDWEREFSQMPVSQGYKYLLVLIGTFTGWIEGFPTWTEKAEEMVKKNCSMKSFWDLVCPAHYKVTVGHHLLLRSPKGSLKLWHYLLPTLCLKASVFRKSRKIQPIIKLSDKER